MARTPQISKEKQQSIITSRHGQSMQKISRTLKVSSSAIAKTIKRYVETSFHKNRHMNGRPRITSSADKFIRVNCTSEMQPK
jgi:transposase